MASMFDTSMKETSATVRGRIFLEDVSILVSGNDENSMMPWEDDDWIPRMKSGKQRTPNMIRNELQRYIDTCKAERISTQTAIIEESLGVNNNSFRKFMNPKTYKDPWSATQNSTYWAAARLLEKVKYEKEQSKKAEKSSGKRKANPSVGGDSEGKKTKAQSKLPTNCSSSASSASKEKSRAELKQDALALIQRISEVEVVSECVFDTCPQIVGKIKPFLLRDGMSKSLLCTALGHINSNSMARFLAGKNQDQSGNVTYKAAYLFFEKLRILEGDVKSQARLQNEVAHPNGFSLAMQKGAGKWIFSCQAERCW
jgi:hypothetical protein